jgi:hypothetical protein
LVPSTLSTNKEDRERAALSLSVSPRGSVNC